MNLAKGVIRFYTKELLYHYSLLSYYLFHLITVYPKIIQINIKQNILPLKSI